MTNDTGRRRNMRWWIPLTLIGAAIASTAYLRAVEQPFIEPIALGIGLLTALLLALWYVFLTGLRWTTRFLLAGIGALLVSGAYLGVKHLTRVEGSIGGSGIPRLAWKWSPKRDAAITRLVVNPSAASPEPAAEAAVAPGTGFPQFLGADRSGVLAGVRLERDWSIHPPRPLWRQPIGLGWSAFAIAGERALTQEQRQEQELIVCYELQTGRPLWAHTNLARFSEQLGGDGPRATPTIREERVYAMGATGILDCLELATGRLVWSRDVLRENQLGNITWGKSCSPLLLGELVVVTGGSAREKSLLAYEAATGKAVWQSGRDQSGYCSPERIALAGQDQIVVVNGHSVTGHDPKDGAVLWDYAWPGDFPKVTQPMSVDSNRLFVAAGYGLGCVMLKIELQAPNHWTVGELWKNRNLKPKFTNLVPQGNHVYGLDDGILACLNLETGQREWKAGRYGHGQILLAGDLLLIQAESGDVALVEANPQQYRETARFAAITGKTWNNPALVGDLLLVRNDQEAACYRLPLGERAP